MFELELRARIAERRLWVSDQPLAKKSPRVPAEPTFGEIICQTSCDLMDDCTRIFSPINQGCCKIFEIARSFFD